MRLLLVEDDLMLGESLQEALVAEHYLVDWHKDGDRLLRTLEVNNYDALILDIGLPKVSGLTLLTQIRAQQIDLPVLILTARDSVADRVHGLDAGADDYVLKPFDLKELLARIRRLMRRRLGRATNAITFGEVHINPDRQEVTDQGETLRLSKYEYMLLKLLIEHAEHVVTRKTLEAMLYGQDEFIESNTLEVHIHHLRKKLKSIGITTLRGVGYMVNVVQHAL